MKIRAEQKNIRQSPRKARLVANQVRKMTLTDAFEQLALMERNVSVVLLKVMRQAVANAVNNHQLSYEDLKLENIIVKVGPTYKRWQPVSRGRAHKILKRTCHVEVTLTTNEDQEKELSIKKNKRQQVISKKKTVAKKNEIGKTTKAKKDSKKLIIESKKKGTKTVKN